MDYYNSTGVFDNSTNSNFATFSGGIGASNNTTGKFGNAFTFDGVDDQLRGPQMDNLLNNSMGTIEAWAYIKNIGANQSDAYELAAIVNDHWLELGITNGNISGDDRIWFYSNTGDIINTTYNYNEWMHLAWVHSNDTLYAYKNGILIDSISSGTFSPGGSLRIGGNENAFGDGTNGSIDEVRVHSRVLSAEEINASYNNGLYRLKNNFTSLSDGTYNYSAYAIDTNGNLDISAYRTVILGSIPVSSCTVIDSPGIYVLTNDIMNAATKCIDVRVSNVTFDGQGYMVDDATGGFDYGIYVYNASGISNVIVKNVVLNEWFYAMRFSAPVEQSTIHNNTFTASGIFYGILFYGNSSNITNNTFQSNSYGIRVEGSNNTIKNNSMISSGNYGFQLAAGSDNTIYNNFFNNTNNVNIGAGLNNTWNTTNTSDTNIVGGPNLGGNYWANPTGTGFSETCYDIHGDKICDLSYTLASGNVDYLPLTLVAITPTISSCSVISSPGTYHLNNDIINDGSSTCINITTSNVTIEGQGYFIDGIDTSASYGIYASNASGNLTNIVLNNLNVTDWGYGVYFSSVENSSIENSSVSSSPNIGVYMVSSRYNDITNITIESSGDSGIFMGGSNNTIMNNSILNNDLAGLNITGSNNTIYENVFNNTQNAIFIGAPTNTWNIAKTAGTNVVGGPYLGGNYWTTPGGTGFSETCTDDSGDNICDSNYTLASGNVDNLPLTLWQSISSCSVISLPGTYILINDILNSGSTTCFNITSSNVVLNGQGYTVDGIDSASTFGVYARNASTTLTNVVVKNVNVSDWDYGATFSGVENSSIKNSSFTSSPSVGVQLTSVSYTNLTNNTVDLIGSTGINITDGSNNTLVNNSLINNTVVGLYIDSSDNTFYDNFFNNTVNVDFNGAQTNIWNTTKTVGTNIVGGPFLGGNYWGYPNGSGSSETCTDSNIDKICDSSYTLTSGNVDYLPLTLESPQNQAIATCMTITSPGKYFLVTDLSSTGTCIRIQVSNVSFDGQNFTISGPSSSGVGVYVNFASLITNVTVKNVNVEDFSHGIQFYNVSNSSILNSSAVDAGTNGIFFQDTENSSVLNSSMSYNNIAGLRLTNSNYSNFTNNIIEESTWWGGIINGINNTFNNNSIVNNDFQGLSISSSDNTFYDNYFNNNNVAVSAGETNIWNITKTAGSNIVGGPYLGGNYWDGPGETGFSETCIDNDGDKICDTNYTINALNVDYLPLTLRQAISACTVIISPGNYILTNDILNSSSTTCINITSSDVSLNGQGYTVDGIDSASTYGVYVNNASGITNVTVTNITVSDWYYGVYFTDVENSSIQNISVVSSSNHGVLIISSRYNNFTNITVDSSGSIGINLTDGSNNTFNNNSIINNTVSGLYIDSSDNTFYNNFFNNTVNVDFNGVPSNTWNTTKTAGLNVVGGAYIGGNYWAYPNGTGFSEACSDDVGDQICDTNYSLA
jgi:parallel beta-helix repeat protein